MIRKIFMVSTVVVLVFLIIITPTFISRQTPLGAAALVFIDNMDYQVLIDVHSVVVEYRYWNISMRVAGMDNQSYSPPVMLENETYDLHAVVAKNDTRKFQVNITLFDQAKHGYDYNVTVELRGQAYDYDMVIRKDGNDSTTVALHSTFKDTLQARGIGR